MTQTISLTRTIFPWRGLAPKALGLALLCLGAFMAPTTQAQTLNVLHAFTGGSDGGYPEASIALDRTGNLYSTIAAKRWHLARDRAARLQLQRWP